MTDGKGQWDGQGQLDLESKRFPMKTKVKANPNLTMKFQGITGWDIALAFGNSLRVFSDLGKQLIPCIRALGNSSGSHSSLKADWT